MTPYSRRSSASEQIFINNVLFALRAGNFLLSLRLSGNQEADCFLGQRYLQRN